MYSCTFGKGWVVRGCLYFIGMIECPLVVFSLRELTLTYALSVSGVVSEHARFCVEVIYALYINFHSFNISQTFMSHHVYYFHKTLYSWKAYMLVYRHSTESNNKGVNLRSKYVTKT